MLNSFVAIGRLGRDAEVTTTRNGDPVARFSIAVDRMQRKGMAGEPDWIRCSIFGDRALMLGPYLNKGIMVGVRGRLNSFRTTGENPRQMMRVDVAEVNFLQRPQKDQDSDPAGGTKGEELARGVLSELMVEEVAAPPVKPRSRRKRTSKVASAA